MLAKLHDLRRTRHVSLTNDAKIYGALGDVAAVVTALQRAAIDANADFETFIRLTDTRPALKPLWENPKFVALVKRRLPNYSR
jgi:hypothetical protein